MFIILGTKKQKSNTDLCSVSTQSSLKAVLVDRYAISRQTSNIFNML